MAATNYTPVTHYTEIAAPTSMPTDSMNEQIINLVDSIVSHVKYIQEADAHCVKWFCETNQHVNNLELVNLQLPAHLQFNISEQTCRAQIQAHDMVTALLTMQAHVIAVRRQLRDLLVCNGDEDKIIDDVDAEGWMPNMGGIWRRQLAAEQLAAEQLAASTPSLVSASSPALEIDNIDKASDNYGYPLPHIAEPCIFNDNASEDKGLTPSQMAALLKFWGVEGMDPNVARMEEHVRNGRVDPANLVDGIWAWMDKVDAASC